MGCTPSASSTHVSSCGEVNSQDFHDKYILGEKLGRGAFAEVHTVTRIKDANVDTLRPVMPVEADSEMETKHVRAVKIVRLRKDDKDDSEAAKKLQSAAKKEATVWRTIGNNQNCVRLYELFFDEDLCFMVMEKCSSSLLHFMEGMAELNERSLGNVFGQMLRGITHCHSVSVVHRDIKPDNFLVGGKDGKTVKLADFGLSTTLQKQGKSTPGCHGVFGTAPFMSPEMLLGQWYNENTDVWSFAAMVYVFLFGRFPYMPKHQNSKAMKQAIIEDDPPPSFKASRLSTGSSVSMCSQVAHEFVQALLVRDPAQRPCAQEALNMPWMVSALEGYHMIESDLPSLRPMVYAAKRVGAFEIRDPANHSPVDTLINAGQMARHGIPVPVPQSASNASRQAKLKAQKEYSEDRGSRASHGKTKSSGKDCLDDASDNSTTDCDSTADERSSPRSSLRSKGPLNTTSTSSSGSRSLPPFPQQAW